MLENKVPFLLVFSSSYVVDVGATDKKKTKSMSSLMLHWHSQLSSAIFFTAI